MATIATVTRLETIGADRHAHVTGPDFIDGQEVGPCEIITTVAATIVAGDRVLVEAIPTLDTYVVIGALPPLT